MAKQQFTKMSTAAAGCLAGILAAGVSHNARAETRPVQIMATLGVTNGTDDNAGGRAGPLAPAPDGTLYGTTEFGGGSGKGTVYRLSPPGKPGQPWVRSVVYNFSGTDDAGFPIGGVVRGGDGTLYGSAAGYGYMGVTPDGPSAIAPRSAVYVLRPPAAGAAVWTEQTIATFNGATLTGRLLVDGTGILYGTAQGDGKPSSGFVFRLRPPAAGKTGWTTETLYTFVDGPAGAFPQDGLARGADGSLYGSTAQGGDLTCRGGWGCGTIYRLTPTASGPWRLSLLHAFHGGSDGDRPLGNLLVDQGGAVLGTTYAGGVASALCQAGCGTIFRLEATGNIRTVYNFCASNAEIAAACPGGMQPAGGVVRGAMGQFLGTTQLGGVNRQGTVWSLDAFGKVTTLASLTVSTGVQPSAVLAVLASGAVVGTSAGIPGSPGTVFTLAQ